MIRSFQFCGNWSKSPASWFDVLQVAMNPVISGFFKIVFQNVVMIFVNSMNWHKIYFLVEWFTDNPAVFYLQILLGKNIFICKSCMDKYI